MATDPKAQREHNKQLSKNSFSSQTEVLAQAFIRRVPLFGHGELPIGSAGRNLNDRLARLERYERRAFWTEVRAVLKERGVPL
jgi:hypothetical protein